MWQLAFQKIWKIPLFRKISTYLENLIHTFIMFVWIKIIFQVFIITAIIIAAIFVKTIISKEEEVSLGKLENDNILQTHFRERKKVSKDEDSFDSDLNQSFKDGAPEVIILKLSPERRSEIKHLLFNFNVTTVWLS